MDYQLSRQLGVTDEVTECFCCGRTGLKKTVVFESSDEWQSLGGDRIMFFGTSCAERVKGLTGQKFADITVKVNKNGLTQSEQQLSDEIAAIKIAYARKLVSIGKSLHEAWDIVRKFEAQDNGIYRMSQILNNN
jgi:hypothetical protein